MATSTRTWVAGAAAAVVLLVLAAWFLLISPQRADAQALAADTASTEATNDVLEASVQQLRSDFVDLPDRQAELVEAQQGLPADLALSKLTRQVSDAAEGAGVRLMTVSPAVPGTIDAVAAQPATGAETPAGTDATTGTAAVPASTTSGAAVPTPVDISVVGALSNSEIFLQQLQSGARDLLVTDLVVTAEEPAAADAGKPATQNGDVTLTVTALVFVLPGTSADTTTAADATSNGDLR